MRTMTTKTMMLFKLNASRLRMKVLKEVMALMSRARRTLSRRKSLRMRTMQKMMKMRMMQTMKTGMAMTMMIMIMIVIMNVIRMIKKEKEEYRK